ncbi:MAG: EF-hand domain-containing protein [Acidobacteria bacterium]|nr:EF-hand domain-containing protein [Acidobacteriota bacterium]
MRSRVLAPGTTVMALALTLGLTGCEATSQPPVEATDQPRVEATGQPPEAATGQPPEAATGQPPEDVQPEAREDDDRRLRTLPAFRALDTDDDGEISAGEIDAAPASLASLDDDGDGRLSRDELRPRQDGPRVFFGSPANPPEGTRMMTLGADEELDIADLPPQLRSLLSPADGDGDGKASGLELLAAMMAAQGGEPGNREPGSAEGTVAPSQGIGSGGGGGDPQVQMPLMAALDANQDGTVSETEIESAAPSLRPLDADGDGRISTDELRLASGSDSSGSDLPE